MKLLKVLVVCLAFAASVSAHAELVGTFALNPATPSLMARGPDVPGATAWTFADDPDIWNLDLSGYSGPVSVAIRVTDAFTVVPDDYDIYWNDTFLGNTLTALSTQVFLIDAAPTLNALKIVYKNQYAIWAPDNGGSYYNLKVSTHLAPVPVPAALWLMVSGVAGVLGLRRKLA